MHSSSHSPAGNPANDPLVAELASNMAEVRRRIAAAATHAGRQGDEVSLIAVSKTHPTATVEAALKAGQRLFGENRVQEAAAKFPQLREQWPDLRLHIIGGLQSNKARDAVEVADAIDSLDRPKLAEALAHAMDKTGRRPDLLIQVNVGNEPQKAGVAAGDFAALYELSASKLGLPVKGVMCIPPAEHDPVGYFRQLHQIARDFALPVISMGMSGDYEKAVAHGATHVRVGSAIFGSRPSHAVVEAGGR